MRGQTYWSIIVLYDTVNGPWPIRRPAAFPFQRWTVECALVTSLGSLVTFLNSFFFFRGLLKWATPSMSEVKTSNFLPRPPRVCERVRKCCGYEFCTLYTDVQVTKSLSQDKHISINCSKTTLSQENIYIS